MMQRYSPTTKMIVALTLVVTAGVALMACYASLYVERLAASSPLAAAYAPVAAARRHFLTAFVAVLSCLLPVGWLLMRRLTAPLLLLPHSLQEELRLARAQAAAATRAKDDFLANMSHEIRTPLNAALGMLYLLQQTTLDQRQRSLTDKAQSAATLLLRIINAGEVNFEGVRVLLVEDNPVNQEVAQAILQARGVTVDVARNGAEAVTLVTAAQARYHAVLMDVHMPVMDGLEATRRIRAHRQFATLPIIAMTASAPGSDRTACLEAGMDDQVDKPIHVPELFATLARWVVAVPGGHAPAAQQQESPVAELPALDRELAVKRLGSRRIYRRLLSTFSREHRMAGEALLRALEQGDVEQARRIVHTLKGAAGNVGAEGVRAAAIRLEEALMHGGMVAPPVEEFTAQLARLLQAIPSEFPEGETEAGVPGGADPATADHLVCALAKLLEAHNLTALEVWGRLKPLVAEGNAKKMDGAMAVLDFADASRVLRCIAAERGISL